MKKVLCIAVSIILIIGMTTGCINRKETSSGQKGRMTISVGYPKAENEKWKNDDYYKYLADKFNIDIDFKTLSVDSADEKARIWISSGDMPDVVSSNTFVFAEYLKYGKQGLVKALPADWQTKYPNLGFSMAMTGGLDMLKNASGGEIYGLLRPMDHYWQYSEEFRDTYNKGGDLYKMMTSDKKYRYIDKWGFAYRKDWARQLGIKTSLIMDYNDFMEMARRFKEADLGKVGADNAVGILVDYTEAPNIFVTAFNSSYKYFHKNESGKYVCGLLEDTTKEGLKEYVGAYQSGLLAPDFYTQKTQDLNSVFCSQRAGILFPGAETSQLSALFSDFNKANPSLNAQDCIDICWIKSPDGKVHGRDASNFYGGYYFSPKLSDEKFSKILELADYVSSPAGGPQVRLGVPDKDYKFENGEYSILRKKNEKGIYDNLNVLYPSYDFFRCFLNPQFMMPVFSNPYAQERMLALNAEKLNNELSLLEWDNDRDTYSADDYVKFNATYEVNSMFAEIVVSNEDAGVTWDKKRQEIAGVAESVLKNMNDVLSK